MRLVDKACVSLVGRFWSGSILLPVDLRAMFLLLAVAWLGFTRAQPVDPSNPIVVVTSVVLPVKNATYKGLSSDFPVDGGAVANKLYYEQLWPAVQLAFAAALANYSVKFDPLVYTYNPCTTSVAWDSLRWFTKNARNATRKVDLYVGPPCTSDAWQSGIVSQVYPSITMTGSATLVDKFEQFQNLVRCCYSTYTVWSGMLAMAPQMGWNKFAVIYDDTDSVRTVWATSLMTKLSQAQMSYVQLGLNAATDIPSLLEAARKQARIMFVICPARMREFMMAAADNNMTGTDYMYFTLQPFPATTILAFNASDNWNRGDANDTRARLAYSSLYYWAVKDATKTPAYLAMDAALKAKYGNTYASNYFSAVHYDCVMTIARGIRNAANAGVDFRANYTYTVNTFIANTTLTGPSGTMAIKATRERNEDFALWGMTNKTGGNYTVVGTFSGSTNNFTLNTTAMLWPANGTGPPLNEPPCGYEGDSPNCTVVTSYVLPIALGLGIPGSVLLIVATSIHYKRRKFEEQEERKWIAYWRDLVVIRPGGPAVEHAEPDDKPDADHTKHDHEKDVEDKEGNEERQTDSENKELNPEGQGKEAGIKITINTGLWKNQAVTVRWSKKRRMRLTKQVQKEVQEARTQTHDNVMAFKGGCLEDDKILIVYENCSKGCLTDLISDANLKLDWTLRFSLMSDCMKGLSYIHGHVLKVHGRLTSMCCYVDSRFMLKIGDYGLQVFFELTLAELWAAKREPEYLTAQLWKAPEHLKAEAQSRYEVISSVSQKGDVYSFGIIVQELILRSKPFSMFAIPEEELIENIKQSVNENQERFIPIIDETACPAELAELCDHCWASDPAKRPNMVQVRAKLKELGKQLGMGERSNILDTLLQQMEDMELNLQSIVEEKGEMLLDEKNRSDELLYSVLPQDVAEIMKVGQKARPENYEQVSVMHCDILEFADLSQESTALQMVDLINDLADYFDATISKYAVHKIDSFKECTVIVSGLSKRSGVFHANEIARAALQLLFGIRKFRVRHRPQVRVSIRMGIHAGPVMAGVVGALIPRYLLFGDTISVSSQMLTGGEAMKIQLSLVSKLCLDKVGHFELAERGEIFIKGKGAMKTYWLLGEEDNPELEELRHRFEERLDEVIPAENVEDDNETSA